MATIRDRSKHLSRLASRLAGTKVPRHADWIHEVKRVGDRLIVQRGERVRLFTRNGYDWTSRYPLVVAVLEPSYCCITGKLGQISWCCDRTAR